MQSFGVLNNFIMLELRWYNDEIVFNHDCYSFRYRVILVNIE
jgi:hypothetical protein